MITALSNFQFTSKKQLSTNPIENNFLVKKSSPKIRSIRVRSIKFRIETKTKPTKYLSSDVYNNFN